MLGRFSSHSATPVAPTPACVWEAETGAGAVGERKSAMNGSAIGVADVEGTAEEVPNELRRSKSSMELTPAG